MHILADDQRRPAGGNVSFSALFRVVEARAVRRPAEYWRPWTDADAGGASSRYMRHGMCAQRRVCVLRA